MYFLKAGAPARYGTHVLVNFTSELVLNLYVHVFARMLLIASYSVGLFSRWQDSWEKATISSWLSLQANLH